MGIEWVGYLDHVRNMGNEFTVFVLNPEELDMTDRLTNSMEQSPSRET
jgi:hypothetical protein